MQARKLRELGPGNFLRLRRFFEGSEVMIERQHTLRVFAHTGRSEPGTSWVGCGACGRS